MDSVTSHRKKNKMKKWFTIGGGALALAVSLTLLTTALVTTTGCTTVTTGTNVVTVIDPVRLQQAKLAIEPAVSSVLRRVMLRSPQHVVEIGNYARAVGTVFCQMAANRNFSPAYLIAAADKATLDLQATAPPEIIDAKNAAIALYQIFLVDKLMVSLPRDQWQLAICQLFCESINQALKDAGQPGI